MIKWRLFKWKRANKCSDENVDEIKIVYSILQNTKMLVGGLKNLQKTYKIPEEIFGHLDFVTNLAASKLYDVVIADMKSVLDADEKK